MAIAPNKNKLRRSILAISQAFAWFPADADCVHLAAGVCDVWNDVSGRSAVAFAATHRPAYNVGTALQPKLVFAGAEAGAASAAGFNGLAGQDWVLVYKDGASFANYRFLASYNFDPNAVGNRSVLYTYVGTGVFGSYWSDAPTTHINELDTGGALPTTMSVLVARQHAADGVGACRIIRIDGADAPGCTTVLAGNMAAVTNAYTTQKLEIGGADTAFGSGVGNYPAIGDFCDVLAAPPAMTVAIGDMVQKCFKALRGTA